MMQRKKAFTLIEAVVVVLIIAILAAILFPLTTRRGEGVRGSACRSNLEQIGLAFRVYTRDCDDKFPPVAGARAENWTASLQLYLAPPGFKGWPLFQCPSDQTSAPQTTDYFFNARLSHVEAGAIYKPSQTILSGDGAGDSPASYHLSRLPAAWRTDQNSPAWRHLDGANYGFGDGHVRWMKVERIASSSPSQGAPTFEVRP